MNDSLEAITIALTGKASKQQTANRAAQILVNSDNGFVLPTAKQKRVLLVEFAKQNVVIYGKAFDILKTRVPIDLDDSHHVSDCLKDICLYEIKSTNKSQVGPDFAKYFFALTTAELLVAQSLKAQYMFAFVNILTGEWQELTLQQVFARAKGIYPTWSICF